jgi:GT2 family glycosyltransferase
MIVPLLELGGRQRRYEGFRVLGASMIDTETRSLPLVYVVVLNWNNWKDAIECLEQVFRSDYPNYRVIVCDNNSQDGSLERIKAWADGRRGEASFPSSDLRYVQSFVPVGEPIHYVEYDRSTAEQGGDGADAVAPLILIQTGENLGYAGGNNVGLRYVFRSDPKAYALVLNPDVRITRDFLSKAVSNLLADSARKAAVVGFPIYSHENRDSLECAYMQDAFARGWPCVRVLPKEFEQLSILEGVIAHGAAMLIAPSAPIKLFPEEYFLYGEDVDYCKQIMKRGGNIIVQLDNPVYHLGSTSIGVNSPVQIYYSRRSKLALCRKYNSHIEYRLALARILYSTLKGWLVSSVWGNRMAARAYLLSFWHHLQGKKGHTWI